MLKLKLQYFSHLMRRTNSLEKTLMLKRLKAGGEGDDRGWDGWMSSPSPRVCLNSSPLSHWYHPTISSSVVPFSSCLQSFPASGSLQMRQFFASGGQSIGVSASSSVLPMNIQAWFLLGLTGWISFLSKGLSRVFSSTTVWRHQFFGTQPFLLSSSHIYTWLLEKPKLWLYWPL